jgi:hypothetical protein
MARHTLSGLGWQRRRDYRTQWQRYHGYDYAEDYGQIREMLENTCAIRETKAAYETLKARPVQIDTAARTATLPLEVYEQLIAERYARFAVIREMQENAPDLSEEEINAVVSETIQEIRAENAASGS